MRRMTIAAILILILLPAAGNVFAQEQGFAEEPPSVPEHVPEEDLDTFFNALMRIQEKQAEYQQKAEEMIEDSDLSQERFNEINRIKNAFPEEEDSISRTESREYNDVMGSIEGLNTEFHQETTTIIRDEGMTAERFQVIANYINANPEVLEERMN